MKPHSGPTRMNLTRRQAIGFLVGLVAISLIVALSSSTASRAAVVRGPVADPNATLTVAIDQPIGSLDPRANHASLNARPLWNLYEGLVTENWYAGPQHLKMVPALAKSWSVSKDGLTYTFNLRHGVKFSDGTPFNAAAAVFDFRTMFDSTFQYYYPTVASFDKALLPTATGFTATAPYTFKITLSAPDAQLLPELALHEEFFMISPTAIQKYGNAAIGTGYPEGTGPFYYVSYNPSTSVLVLNRNANYWRGSPKFKTLILQLITDESARVSALEGHSVDIADNVLLSNAPQLTSSNGLKMIIRQQPTVKTCELYAKTAPGNNKLFREALSLAINRAQMNSVVYGGKGGVAHGFFTDNSPAYDPKMPPLEYNLAKAKKLLKQSGVKTPVTLTLDTASGDQNAAETFSILQQDWAALGVTLNIVYSDGTTYVHTLTGGIQAGSPYNGVCQTTNGTDDPSLIFAIYGVEGFAPNGYNAVYYDNPKITADYTAMLAAKNVTAYYAAISKANQDLVSDFGAFVMIQDVEGFGESTKVAWVPAAARDYMYENAVVYK